METFNEIQLWPVFAGLGLFLFGMFMLEESLKNLAGRSFKLFLRKNTNHPLKAIFSGALVTSVLQSSSLVTLLVMSLAGAGIIGLKSGMGMIMGANLGTTATGWLVSLVGFKMDIEAFILPFLAIGGLGIAFLKSERLSNFSKLLMGFSFMFLGLNYMKNSFAHLATQVDLSILQDKPIILFVFFGLIFTALIQSSSASMTIYLSSLAAGIISLPQAAYLIIGSDLGTTITVLIGTINGNPIRKKVGWFQFIFNFVNACLALLFFNAFFFVIQNLIGAKSELTSLVLFHSIMNFTAILFTLPLIAVLSRLLEKYLKSDSQKISRYLALGNPKESISALESLEKEASLFIDRVQQFNSSFFGSGKNKTIYLPEYLNIKQYENEIRQFYISLQQVPLTQEETVKINNLVQAVRNASLSAKDLKDIKHNLDEFANATSDLAQQLLVQIQQNQQQIYKDIKHFSKNMEGVSAEDLDLLNVMQNKFYREQTDSLYQLFSDTENELSTASGLNMLREINNSNDAFIKAFKSLIR